VSPHSLLAAPVASLPDGVTILDSGVYSALALGSTLYACQSGTAQGVTSTDYGTTWTPFAQTFPADLTSIFPLKDGTTLLACAGTGAVYRSTDSGTSWAVVFNANGNVLPWAWAQDSAGRVFAGEYRASGDPKCIYVWRSTDNGANWTRLDGLFALSNKHVHVVFVDAETDRLYVTIGDTPKASYYSDNQGDTWTQMFSSEGATGFTGITSLPGARFFITDNAAGLNRIHKSTDDSALTTIHTPPWQYDISIGSIAAVHGASTIVGMFSGEGADAELQASILKSTDSGATWSVVIASTAYAFQFPAHDWRGRIPAELGYIICDIVENSQMLRIAL
jgi:hypothetical protein